MFAAKSYQVTRPGLKKPKPKKRKLPSGGALSARSGSTGSLPAYPTPRQTSGRQRSLTADQPRLRHAQLDSRVRESAAMTRPGRRLAPPASQPGRQLQLGDRLPSLRARIAEMKALASFFPDSEVSVSDATGSDTRANIANILKLRDYEQKAIKTRRKPFKPAGVSAAPGSGSQRSRRLEPPVRGRRPVSGPVRDGSFQRGSPPRPRGRTGSSASSGDRRDRPAPGGDGRGRADSFSDERDDREHRDRRDHRDHRDHRDNRDYRHERDHRDERYDREHSREQNRRNDRDKDNTKEREHRDHQEGPVRRGERDGPGSLSDDQDRRGYHSDERGPPGKGSHRDRSDERGPPGQKANRELSEERSRERERPAPPASVQSEQPPSLARSDGQDTSSNSAINPLKLLASLQIPNLNELAAGSANGSPRNLHDVIKNFMWAKQQASATANVMSNLRSIVETGAGAASQSVSEVGADRPASQPAADRAPPAAVPDGAPAPPADGGWHDGRPADEREVEERAGTASSAASLASSAGTTYLLPGDSRSQLAASSKHLAGRGLHEGGSEAGSALRSISEAGLQSGVIQSTQSGALQSVHSGGLPSTQSGAIQSSRSGPLQSGQSGLQSGQSDLRSGQDVNKQLTGSQEHMDVNQLRAQFKMQQAKLKQMEQKNYVLSLAVEGQEKTIRTMTNELQDAREASRGSQPAVCGPVQQPLPTVLSAQSCPIESSKTEVAVDNVENKNELERLTAILETRDLCDGWRPRLDGGRTRSTEQYRPVAADRARVPSPPLRRHSFTVPPPRAEDVWIGAAPCPSRLGHAAVSCQSTPLVGSGRPPPCVGSQEPPQHTAGLAGRQDELRQTVQESLSRVKQLETELAELRCTRDRDRDRDRGDHGGESRGLLADLMGPAEPAAGLGRLCKPFPQIVRMTELKLQQTYQSLVAEQNKNKLLNKALHEANTRLEQQASQAERLKERLTSSVEERRQLQSRLSAAESAVSAANSKQQQLSEELQRKTDLLAQASQYLDERIDQVAVLSRELDTTRAEAAHEARLAGERLAQLRARAAELENLTAKQEAENRVLRQASADTDQLTQSGRQLRQRVLELSDKLERSTANCKMLENYVLFLKASYSKMFGSTATPAPGPGLDVPQSLRDLLEQAETQ
ncbi:Outer dense fiber protein 2 [Amphibalanus amphitrite]|uniref:Outer dense fiber protein 2 n=2 Tax=Amphibalanus amphitrite TaxID=1232801 RepID=A0A6A4VVW5_AMPAM|nr:Outer dense fiber protein 2 [Amphibalanus amphitrite]